MKNILANKRKIKLLLFFVAFVILSYKICTIGGQKISGEFSGNVIGELWNEDEVVVDVLSDDNLKNFSALSYSIATYGKKLSSGELNVKIIDSKTQKMIAKGSTNLKGTEDTKAPKCELKFYDKIDGPFQIIIKVNNLREDEKISFWIANEEDCQVRVNGSCQEGTLFGTIFFDKYGRMKNFLFIISCLMFILFGMYFSFVKNTHKLELFFVIYSIVFGLIYSTIIPIALVPDEPSHAKSMSKLLGADEIYNQYMETVGDLGMGKVMNDVDEQIDYTQYKKSLGRKFDKESIDFSPVVSYKHIKYLPSTMGVVIGYFFDLPIIITFQIAEMFSLLFFVIMGVLALKIMPIKRELFCAVMLSPMVMQQCASINYDSVLLPCCFFLVAHVFYLKEKKLCVGYSDVIVAMILVTIITLIKPPYVLLGIMYFIIPHEKIVIKIGKINIVDYLYKYRYLISIIFTIIFGVGVYLFRDNEWVMRTVVAFSNLPHFLELLWNVTFVTGYWYIESMIGNFGWLTCAMPKMIVISIIILWVVLSLANTKTKLNLKNKIVLCICIILLYFLIQISMLSWTFLGMNLPMGNYKDFTESFYKITTIGGVQGRYLLPMVMPALLLFDNKKISVGNQEIEIAEIFYFALVSIWPIYEILNRFWSI